MSLRSSSATLLFFCLGLGALLPLSTYAQTPELDASFVSIVTIPASPKVGEPTEVTVQSSLYNLDRANIVWSVNGKGAGGGIGRKTITTPLLQKGIPLKVAVTLYTAEGATIQKSIVLGGSEVSIGWQSDSYTPGFYKGKALLAREGTLTLVTFARLTDISGNIIPQNELVYTWSRGGVVLGDRSGTGKNTLTLALQPVEGPLSISVKAKSLTGDAEANGTVAVPTVTPRLLLYEHDPLGGVLFNKALGQSMALRGPEVTLFTVPYYISGSIGAMTFSWIQNGSSIGKNSREVTFGGAGNTSGISTISVTASNSQKLLQSAAFSLSLSYGGANGSEPLSP